MKKLLLSSTLFLAGIYSHGQIVMNELMQSNIDGIMDDLNDFPDSWVELYNSGDQSVNIKNYKIGLESDPATAYSLPSKNIPAGAYLLVYCDKVGSGLHTDFRIDSGKGSLFLFDNQGNQIDALESIKKQPAPNIAMGRLTDGDGEWGYELTPTPGAQNAGGHSKTILSPVQFSVAGGVWNQTTPISLELSVADDSPEGSIILYTIDGSEPSMENGIVYDSPIQINSNTVVRAKTFCDGCISIPGNVQSYLFLGREIKIPVFSIVIDDKYLYDNEIGIFAHGNTNQWHDENWFKDWRRPMNIEFFEGEGVESAINQLGEMRIQGGYTRENPLKSLAVYANKRFGTKRLSYEFWQKDKPGVSDNKSIILRNGGNDYNNGFFRDAMCQRMICRNSHNLDWQGYSPAIVFINGQYHAMLAIRERSNEDNIYSNYNGLEDIDMYENWNELKAGDDVAFKEFKEFYRNEHSYDEWNSVINLDSYIDLMIINYWVYNHDFPDNNTVFWRKRSGEDTRWRWLIKDCDYSMGIYGQYGPNENYGDFLNSGSGTGFKLWKKLMANQDFKDAFVNRFIVYSGDFMTAAGFKALLQELIDENEGEQLISVDKWRDNPWWPNIENNWDGIRDWLDNRESKLPNHLKKTFSLGSPVKVSVAAGLNDSEAQNAGISYNGIKLLTGRFNGSDYQGRTIYLDADDDSQITGWKLKVGSAEPIELTGRTIEYTISSAGRLEFTPIFNGSGIKDIEADNNLLLEDDIVIASGQIQVYDALGRKVASGKDAARLPSQGIYFVHANGKIHKIVY